MPKFKVCLGRLVRETATVIVKAPDIETLDSRLREVYDAYEGSWEEDQEWGAEESDCHEVLCETKIGRAVITLK